MLYGAGEIAHSINCLTCKAKDVNLILGTCIKQAKYGIAQLQLHCREDKQEISGLLARKNSPHDKFQET